MSDSEEQPTLFEINESHLDTGLRGVPVGTCKTSFVSSTKGVHYVGYPISVARGAYNYEYQRLIPGNGRRRG